MNVESYLQKKRLLSEQAPQYRHLCLTCRQPQFGCFCAFVQNFDPKIKFMILIHPIEFKRRIATGRMSHLCLENSELIIGQNYSANQNVNDVLRNPENHCVILYPGRTSIDLTSMDSETRQSLFPKDKKLVIFVIDGTWATAGKMVYQSKNLIDLPRICFTPPAPSNFRVRKQPAPGCYSTIEAIHHTLELLGPSQGFDLTTLNHHKLIFVFDKMVEKQLEFIDRSRALPKQITYRRLSQRPT